MEVYDVVFNPVKNEIGILVKTAVWQRFPGRKCFIFHSGYCSSFLGGAQSPALSSKTAVMILLIELLPNFWSWYKPCTIYFYHVDYFPVGSWEAGEYCMGSESYFSINTCKILMPNFYNNKTIMNAFKIL